MSATIEYPSIADNPDGLDTVLSKEQPVPNEQVYLELQPTLELLYHDKGLPAWCVVCDKRVPDQCMENVDKHVMEQIDGILDSIVARGLDTHNKVDHGLRTWAKKIILLANRRRLIQGYPAFSQASLVMLTHEIWYTDHLHFQHVRKTGESYARTHLFESVINGIVYGGVCTELEIIAILRHDDYEDLHSVTIKSRNGRTQKRRLLPNRKEFLLCDKLYLEQAMQFLNGDSKEHSIFAKIEIFRDNLHTCVEDLTKEKKANLPKEHEDTYNARLLFQSARKHSFIILLIKFCERLHNLQTLTGHNDVEKEKRIVRMSARIFLPMAK